MRINQNNFAIYIVTYNRPKVLNESIRQYLDSLAFVPRITVISNHSNCRIDDDLKNYVRLIFNNLRPDESWGYLTRNWNQCFQFGLRECEWLLCSQDDVIIKPGWFELVNSANFDFYLAPLGDTRFLLNRSAFRRVGWFDERFTGVGFHEHDYLIRVLSLIPESATIVDDHRQKIRHNPIGLEKYWLQPEADNFVKFKQRGGRTQAKFQNIYRQKFFQEKWGTHPFKKVIGLHPYRLPAEIDWYPFISAKYEFLRIANPQYRFSEKKWQIACRRNVMLNRCHTDLLSIPKCKLLAYCHLQNQTNPELLEKIYRHVNQMNEVSADSLGLIVLYESEEIIPDGTVNNCIKIYGKQHTDWREELLALTDFTIFCEPQDKSVASEENEPGRLVFNIEKFLTLSLDRLQRQLAEANCKWYISQDERKICPQALPEDTVLVDLGKSCLKTKHYRDALNYFKQAVEINPQNAEAWVGLAQLAKKFGDEDAFRKVYHRAYALAPASPELKKLGFNPEPVNSKSALLEPV
jgi:hypothetical protein